jgi:hypothetical protein
VCDSKCEYVCVSECERVCECVIVSLSGCECVCILELGTLLYLRGFSDGFETSWIQIRID